MKTYITVSAGREMAMTASLSMILRVAASYLHDAPKEHPYSRFMLDPRRRTVKDWEEEEKIGPGHLITEKELRERARHETHSPV